jgi:large subunit ribosomal protein L10
MTRTQKGEVLEALKAKIAESDFFYLADTSTLTVAQVNELRAAAFQAGISIQVVKNTLARKALESVAAEKNTEGLYEALKGPTAIMFTEVAKAPAKLIKEFRKKHDKPVLKAAYIDSAIYIGDDQVEALSQLKSKEELVGDVIMLLQSPIKNVLGSLQSGGQTISGLLKALEERAS